MLPHTEGEEISRQSSNNNLGPPPPPLPFTLPWVFSPPPLPPHAATAERWTPRRWGGKEEEEEEEEEAFLEFWKCLRSSSFPKYQIYQFCPEFFGFLIFFYQRGSCSGIACKIIDFFCLPRYVRVTTIKRFLILRGKIFCAGPCHWTVQNTRGAQDKLTCVVFVSCYLSAGVKVTGEQHAFD